MRRMASYLGRGAAILGLGLAIAGLTGYLAYLGLTAAVRHFVE
jgi:preprotein translocase subunit Sss1